MHIKVFKVRIADEFLIGDQQKVDHFLVENDVVKFETAFVQDDQSWSVILYYRKYQTETNSVRESKAEKYSADDDILTDSEIKIFEALKMWRSEKARDQNLPTYFIATNKELTSVAKYKPSKKQELLDIKGFGKHKIENYGEEIIEILESV
ncbi:aldolase [Chryseobacterium sp. Leaf404]|uniref:HRDC domain-containing protein n=1 Tax=unclassified Chryseobacterium TaxID=2593645 RepID=UPI0006F7A085|nr:MULTISPECIES: HRDC domain-containing protein [unclassified Chryseobacterium]KQT17390.1 aldolase [Chryseobacterium sp. Leaf404]